MSVYDYNNDSVAKPKSYDDTNSVATPSPVPAAPGVPSWSSADPNQNPAYQTFLRSMGMDQAQITSQTARQKNNLSAQLEAQRPVWAQTMAQGLSGVMNNAAGRGTVRSSNRVQNQNLVQQGVNRQQAAYEGGIAEQIGNLDANQQAQLLQLQRQRAEQELAARSQVYQQNVGDYENQLTNYYLQQLMSGAL